MTSSDGLIFDKQDMMGDAFEDNEGFTSFAYAQVTKLSEHTRGGWEYTECDTGLWMVSQRLNINNFARILIWFSSARFLRHNDSSFAQRNISCQDIQFQGSYWARKL